MRKVVHGVYQVHQVHLKLLANLTNGTIPVFFFFILQGDKVCLL